MVKAAGSSLFWTFGHVAWLVAPVDEKRLQERMDDNYVCEIPDVVSLADKSTNSGMLNKTLGIL